MRQRFLFLMSTFLLGAFLFSSPTTAEAQNRTGRKHTTTTTKRTIGKQAIRQNPHSTPTPVGDTERTIYDMLYFPFSCLNAEMPTKESAWQEISNTFGTCEDVNLCPGLHAGDALDFTYRGVSIGVCYYDWYSKRTYYDFYFASKEEADQFFHDLTNDIRGVGIPLTRDKIYGGMSNRNRPVSVFKWVSVDSPVKVKEADTSNIDTPAVVGMYKVELDVMKK